MRSPTIAVTSIAERELSIIVWNSPRKGYKKTLLRPLTQTIAGVVWFAPRRRKSIRAPITSAMKALRMLRIVNKTCRIFIHKEYDSETKKGQKKSKKQERKHFVALRGYFTIPCSNSSSVYSTCSSTSVGS